MWKQSPFVAPGPRGAKPAGASGGVLKPWRVARKQNLKPLALFKEHPQNHRDSNAALGGFAEALNNLLMMNSKRAYFAPVSGWDLLSNPHKHVMFLSLNRINEALWPRFGNRLNIDFNAGAHRNTGWLGGFEDDS